ncbi:MAG: hypothetical protein QNL05_05430, partial [Gammaproteobacteria bacterium]|nr:hypothetical protein [Gammaproteobacteria bacterium]MDX2487024.1 hypothetical protein [Gammaproteobacteria bacterium]
LSRIRVLFLCWRTAGLIRPARRESFFNLQLNFHSFIALYGRVSFLCVAKEMVPKEKPPCRVGLRRLCALQLRAGAAELAALKQSSLFSTLSFQCSTTQKG